MAGDSGRAHSTRRNLWLRRDRLRTGAEGRVSHHGSGGETAPADAPSELAIIGRYILTPDIFDMLVAESADTRTGEIQLTNGLKRLLAKRPLYACEVTGVRHDTGNKLGFLKAVVYFALRRPDLAGPFREYLESL
jgi:UTP--glucose-1-phosphate uridylyltransferase